VSDYYFTIKTRNAESVKKILNKEDDIELDGLNVMQENLIIGTPIFIVLGGDRPAWDTGLIGIGIVSKEPYDVGYEKRNFRIMIDMKVLLEKPIKRDDLIPYRGTYGIIAIGPVLKGEPNQALTTMQRDQAIALMRAMAELSPSIKSDLDNLVGADMAKKIFGSTKKMIEVPFEYGQEEKEALKSYLTNNKELENTNTYNVKFNTTFVSKYERNRIIFGAPGTGKSYGLKVDCEDLLKDKDGSYERVTFHPDYSYSQFVGTYKPVMDIDEKSIKYDFVPGPFMRVYVEALKSGRTDNPQPYLLLIEEINRAKVATVFGDVFQLLDRDDNGVSEYEIQASEDIRRYLAKELGGSLDNYQRIRIPNNMFIWATMNSADQGVFPMDTAFKRRWNFEYLGINENEEEISGIGKIDLAGSDEPAEWNILRKAINAKMSSEGFKINEDKLMGPFFLSKRIIASDDTGMIIDSAKFIDAFKSKVIMYLYEDAVKQGKHKFFDGCDSSKYSSVCDAFDEIGMGIFGPNFKENFYDRQRNDA
jgi:hypothetical protein